MLLEPQSKTTESTKIERKISKKENGFVTCFEESLFPLLASMNDKYIQDSTFKIQDSIYLPFTRYANYFLNILMIGEVTSRNH